MTRFILLEKTNISFISQIKNFFEVVKEEVRNNITILYLVNSGLEDLINTFKALALDLFTNSKVYISGAKNDLSLELDLAILNFTYLENGLNLAPQLCKVTKDKGLALNILLGKYIKDRTFNELLKMYFNCNLNVLVTANNLYMHRNTLLYKINAFYEYTGFNLKEFKDAATLYIYINN